METMITDRQLPSYQAFMNPILECCSDDNGHSLKELQDYSCQKLGISEEQRKILVPSGTKSKVKDRTDWAAFYLKRAGCIETNKRGVYSITPRGKELARSSVTVDTKYLERFEEFLEFISKPNRTENNDEKPLSVQNSLETPGERIGKAYDELKTALAEELLEKIKTTISPKQFEHLVVDILASMGYGGGVSRKQDLIEVTSYTNDQGIDGIIKEDALGLDRVCIQAKRYTEGTVGRPDVQRFAGSMDGQGAKKGILITTSSFTKEAKQFAEGLREKRIILIEGNKLAELMIENGVGVTVTYNYVLHQIDTDYFENFA